MRLIVEYLENYDKNWDRLAYAHPDDAGFDLRAAIQDDIVLKPMEKVIVPNGVRFQIDSDSNLWEIQLRPRSGLAAKYGLSVVNAPGTIDYGYRGEVKTILINLGQEDFVIHAGDRIAQAVVCPIGRPVLISGTVTDNTDRSSGGFGSTGGK